MVKKLRRMGKIKCADFDKEFGSKDDLIKELIEKKEELKAIKKAVNDRESKPINAHYFEKSKDTIKAIEMEEGYVYAVINTTNILDSHGDLHVNGIWNKSAQEQNGKTYYVADHEIKMNSIIAYPQDVEVMIKEVSFNELGYNYSGNTQALIFKVAKDKIRLKAAQDVINDAIKIQHSIRMQYVDLDLAVNSDDKAYQEEKETFDKYFPMIANKPNEELIYFWVIKEAKIAREGSMLPFGSNPITPLEQKDIEPSTDTHKKEKPSTDTSKNNFSINELNF